MPESFAYRIYYLQEYEANSNNYNGYKVVDH